MTSLANNLNGITPGTTVTTANSGGTSGNAFNGVSGATTAAAAAAYEGAAGLQIVYPATSGGVGQVFWNATASVGTRAVASFWYKFSAAPGAKDQIFLWGGGQVSLDTSGRLNIQSGNTILATSTTLTPGAWYFVQYAVTANASTTGGRLELNVYGSNGATLFSYDSGATVNAGTGSAFQAFFGRGAAVNNPFTASYDLLAVNTSAATGFPGSPPTYVPPTGGLKVWTGSAWVIKPVKVWTGTAWVTKPVKRWTGSTWVTNI
jgi:hypothetical protein